MLPINGQTPGVRRLNHVLAGHAVMCNVRTRRYVDGAGSTAIIARGKDTAEVHPAEKRTLQDNDDGTTTKHADMQDGKEEKRV